MPQTPQIPKPLDVVLSKIVEEVKKEVIELAKAFDASKAETIGLRILDANTTITRYCVLVDADFSTVDGFAKYIECRILLRVANENKVTDFSDISSLKKELRDALTRARIH